MDKRWTNGPVSFPPDVQDPDGSAFLLSALDGRPETYQSFATDYYETAVDVASVEHVYQHRPLTRDIVASLNGERSLDELASDLNEIGYPMP